MKRVDRRTFLVNGMRTGAVVVATGSVGFYEWETLQPATAGAADLPGPPGSLRINGDASPIGVDPDDVSFAWQVTDPRRGAIQTAYRLTVTPSAGGPARWDSGEVRSGRQAFVTYGGPALDSDTAYRFRVATRDAAGVWGAASESATFVTGLRMSDWKAQWLRPGPADTGLEKYTYLRQVFDIPAGSVDHAVIYTAAAHKYQLWLNGQKLDTGPSFCYPDEQYVQATDVSGALATGARNAVGFLHRWYSAGKGRPQSAPGLLAQISLRFTDGRRYVWATDETWKQRPAEWLPAAQRNTDAGDFVEFIDGRLAPSGWSEAGYDDGDWSAAPVLGPVGTAPFTDLYAQRTRITELALSPTSVNTLDDGAVVLDFGKIYAARPIVDFRQGISGRTISMHVGYVLDPDGHVSTTHATQQTNLAFYYIERDGAQTFDPYTYLGFRYLEIDQPGEEMTRDQVHAMARHCTMPDGPQASFNSSNPTLDAVWALCARSALYTTHEQFVDTPTREKGQFLWDACNESQVILRVHAESNLSFQALRDFARSQKRFWPDGRVSDIYPTGYGAQSYVNFTALYPEWVWRYYLSTGDTATLKSLYPTLERLSEFLWRPVSDKTGLVTGVPLYPSADNNYGYDFDTECDSSINILSANAFARIALIATAVGDIQGAATHRARSTTVSDAVNRYLVGTDGIYADGLLSDGTRAPSSTQLPNIQALAYGLVPSARRAAVGRYVASLGIAVEPDYGMDLLRSLHAAGLDQDVVETLTDATRPGWAWILTHGGTFCWEAWVLSDLIGDSMSHGWGSAALVAMQEALLGVVPAVPTTGQPPTVLEIAPAFGVLDFASGAVPTMSGTASVSWARSRAGLHVAVSLPANSQALMRVPASGPTSVKVGPVPIEHVEGISVESSENGEVRFWVGAGSYELDVVPG
ncbi:MAG: family 78 glycoside hydrolase catalytic domain [Acidimicrobiales bacterium]